MEAEHQRLGHASISGLNHIRVCTDHVKDMFKEINPSGLCTPCYIHYSEMETFFCHVLAQTNF